MLTRYQCVTKSMFFFFQGCHKDDLSNTSFRQSRNLLGHNSDVAGSIQPSLDQISDLITKRVENHTGIAIVEGIEWLVSLHGFSEVLKFSMSLKDSLHKNLGPYCWLSQRYF